MKAVSFMYVRPPGYNAESAKAAEIADESKKQELNDPLADGESTAMYHLHLCFVFVQNFNLGLICSRKEEKMKKKMVFIVVSLFAVLYSPCFGR